MAVAVSQQHHRTRDQERRRCTGAVYEIDRQVVLVARVCRGGQRSAQSAQRSARPVDHGSTAPVERVVGTRR